MLSLYRTKLPFNHSNRVEDLAVCIRTVSDEDASHNDFLGVSGFIFVLPPGMTPNLSSVSINALIPFVLLIALRIEFHCGY